MTPAQAHRNAQLAGAVTAVLGTVLTAAPQRFTRLAGVSDPRLLRQIGISDLALAPGLILDGRRWPWLAARAVANVVVGVRLLREPTTTARLAGLALLAVTVADTKSVLALRAQ